MIKESRTNPYDPKYWKSLTTSQPRVLQRIFRLQTFLGHLAELFHHKDEVLNNLRWWSDGISAALIDHLERSFSSIFRTALTGIEVCLSRLVELPAETEGVFKMLKGDQWVLGMFLHSDWRVTCVGTR